MTIEEFKNLNRGNIVKYKSDSRTYLMNANYGGHITGVTIINLTNPDEWDLILKAKY